MKKNELRRRRSAFGIWAGLLGLLVSLGCTKGPSADSKNFVVVGSYQAAYDAATGNVTYTPIDKKTGKTIEYSQYALSTYVNSAGAYYCAIRDHSNNDPGSADYCMGLIDPDNCSADYNSTTHVLSFYAKLVNKSDLPNDYDAGTNPTGYEYMYPVEYPPNTTYYAPFYFSLWGLDWTGGQLVSAVNTNLSGGDCDSANGMTLDGNDANSNYRFDCMAPDLAFDGYKNDYPGWDFTPHVTGGTMAPGDDTGCVEFMQFTLSSNANITINFDVLAVQDSGSLPPAPTVTTPTDNSYANSTPITFTVSNCPIGSTLYVDGGDAQASQACASATQSISGGVSLKANQENTLSAYYVDGLSVQGPATVISVTHDNTAPSIVSWVPADTEVVVGTVARCVATISEPLLTSTLNAGSGTTGSCATGNFVMCQGTARVDGTISYSSDGTQIIYTPTGALSNSTAYTCNVQVASGAPTTITDLAGNQLPSTTITFTTGTSGQDLTAPYVKSILPVDNTTISPNSSFYVYFSEPVQESTLSATNCSSGGGTPVPNIAVWETNACVVSGYPTPRPNIINGTLTLNADGDIATFTPNSAMPNSDCVAISIGSCILDLAGNALPNTGNFNIGAYNSQNLLYNSWNVFYTSATDDSTGPNLVHVGPMLDATGVKNRIFPFVIFNEPIDVATIVSNYSYMTVFGDPTKLGLSLKADPTLQMVTYRTSSNLTTSTKYVITATGAVADTSGNLMPSPQTSSFTIDATADSTAPTVVSVSPTNGSSPSRCSVVDIDFSEPMDSTSLNGANITLVRVGVGAVPVDLQPSDDGMRVRLIPQSSLTSGAQYRPTITTGVKDRAGNALAALYNSTTWTAAADATAPTISKIVPNTGSTVAQNGSFAIFFDESMDRSTLNTTNITWPQHTTSFSARITNGSNIITTLPLGTAPPADLWVGMTLSGSASGIPGGTTVTAIGASTVTMSANASRNRNPLTVTGTGGASPCTNFWSTFPSSDGKWVVVNCYNDMGTGSLKAVRVSTGVRDRHINSNGGNCESNSGNALATTTTFGPYTVSGTSDTTAPTVSSVSPTDGSTSVSTGVAPSVTFSEPLDPRTVVPSSIFLMDHQGNLVDTNISFNSTGTTLTLTPVQALANPGIYYIVATTALRDLGGGNVYDGNGGESSSISGVLRTCFSTSGTACP